MPLYNVASTSSALGIPQKWLDNLLSHNKIEGVEQARQGVKRRLSIEAVSVVAISYQMVEAMGIPIGKAVSLAEQLIWSPDGAITIADTITVRIDRARLQQEIIHALEQVVEVIPTPARGRPPMLHRP